MNYFQRFGRLSVVIILFLFFSNGCMSAVTSTKDSAAQDSQVYQHERTEQTPTTIAQRLISSIEKEKVFDDILDASQQKQLLDVLNRMVVAERAPRDGDGCDVNGCGTGFAGPCGNSASSDLQVIEQTLCCIKNIIGTPCGSCCVGDACADLQTLFGFLACLCSKIDVISSKIDTLGSCSCIEVVESKLDVCCRQLNSKLDVITSIVDIIEISDSLLEVIDSKIDVCCKQLNSKLDVVDSTVDVIDSKLDLCCGQVNSKLDILLAPCVTDCCALNANDITFQTNFDADNNVLSVDWSFDSKYVVVGYASAGTASQPRIQVFKYNGSTLTPAATYSDTIDVPINSVRFSPINYQIIVTRIKGHAATSTLQTYLFDPVASTLVPQGAGQSQANADYVATSWHPSGNYIIAAYNSPAGGSYTSSTIALYGVNTSNGNIAPASSSVMLTSLYPGAVTATQALVWNRANPIFAAVGTQQGTTDGNDLFVLQFDNATTPSFLSVAIAIDAFDVSIPGDATLSVAWHPSGMWLAAGGDFSIIGDHVLVYTFDASMPSLTQVTSVPLANESRAINALSWSSITGNVLSYVTNNTNRLGEIPSSFVNYCFNNGPQMLSFLSEFTDGPVINDVRWSPNEASIAFGDDNDTLSLYNFDRPSCSELALRLLCKENSKLDVIDSTVDIIDSKLDACCGQLNSKVDIVDSLVEIIDSKLDVCCGQVNSKLDILLQPCITDCCILNANDITFGAIVINNPSIFSVDWSFDDKYIVVGYVSNGTASQVRFEVFKYNGLGSLTSLATISDTVDANVNSVRFSPINYQIAVARDNSGGTNDVLAIYEFTPGPNTLTRQNGVTGNSHVAVAWHPNGSYLLDAENSASSVIRLNRINPVTGTITSIATLTLTNPPHISAFAARQALDWNPVDTFRAAVGTSQALGSGADDLFLLGFNDPNDPTTVFLGASQNAFTATAAAPPSNPDNATLTVRWHPSGAFLAAGAAATVSNDHVKIYSLNFFGGFLTEVTSIPLATESHGIDELDWSTLSGDILSYATDGTGGESFLMNYCFNNNSRTLSLLSAIGTGFSEPLNAMRWSSNEVGIVTGGSDDSANGVLTVYNFDRPSCSELTLRLLCKENSKIDVIGSTVDVIESKLDACCAQLNSKIDHMGGGGSCSTVDVIESKLDVCCGQVNSKIDLLESKLDVLLQPCVTDISCCTLNGNDIKFSTTAIATNSILSVNWSFDNKYVVVGYESAGPASQPRIEVLAYSGGLLISLAAYSDTIDANISSVRFSPINYQIIAARAQGNSPSTEGTLQTYLFDPVGLTLTQQGTPGTFTGGDFVSVTWHPNGNFVLAAVDSPAIGLATGPYTTTDIILYSIVPSGVGAGTLTLIQDLTLTDPVTGFPEAIAAFQAIDWNAANPLYAAVGTQGASRGNDLFVLQFDSSTAPTTIEPFSPGQSFVISAFDNPGRPATLSLRWHPSGNFLAAGGDAGVRADHVQVFTFVTTPSPGLTFLTSISSSIESGSISALDWDPITGDILSYTSNNLSARPPEFTFNNYCFSASAGTLSFLDDFSESASLVDVFWSPNEKFIATGQTGSPNGDLSIYNFTRPNCFQIMLRLLCSIQSCSC